MPAQAATPSVAKPQAAPMAAPAAVQPPAPKPSNHRPLPASSKVRSPKAPVAQGSWSWQNPKPSGNPLFGISCPTATVCFAVGFGVSIERTTNGGATWSPDSPVAFLNGISCASATSCVAVGDGGVIVYTTDGGNSVWQQGASPLNTNWLSGVSCVGSACWLVGQGGLIYHSTNSGATWGAQSSGTTSDLWAVSCSTSTQCMAVGAGGTIVRTSDGTSWSLQYSGTPNLLYGVSCFGIYCVAVGLNGASPIIAGGVSATPVSGSATTLTAVSCLVGSRCLATGVDGAVYRMDGSAGNGPFWLRTSTSETGALYGVSCQTVTACFAAGDYGMVEATSNGASGWTKQAPNSFGLIRSVSCPTTSTCFAVGRDRLVLRTTDGGATWSYQTSNAVLNTTTFWGISCPSATVCFAATGSNTGVADGSGTILATTDGGANWAQQSTPGVGGSFLAISCADTTHCFSATSSGELFVTTDGTTWASQTSPVAGQPLTALSCPTTLVCYAAGSPSTSIGTTDGGAHWNAQGAIGTTFENYGMSCPSTTTCFAASHNNIHVTTNSGATWTNTTASGGSYFGISCFSTTVCTATSGTGVEYTTDGSTWTAKATPATGAYPLGIACPSATVCVAGGEYSLSELNGFIVGTTDANASWQLLAVSSTGFDLAGISCSSPTVCHAIARSSNGSEFDILGTANNGTQWLNQHSDLYSQFQAISCPSDTVCFVVGSTHGSPGSTVFGTTDGGANWNAQITASGASAGFDSISCLNTSACFAAGYDGSIVKTIDGGASWHAMPSVTGAASVSGISCLNFTVCFATDATAGHVYTTQDGGGTWSLSWDVTTDPFAASAGPFYGISCFGAQTCVAVGQSGLVGITTDDGAHWRAGYSGTSATLISISCLVVCFATAADDTLLVSSDNGSTWSAQAPAPHAVYAGVSCADSQTCFAAGHAGAVSTTTVGGQAWTTVNPPASQSTANIFGMSCYGPSNCYAAAGSSLLRTHDGGATWVASTLTNGDQLLGISCPGALTCYAVGWPAAIYQTTDGGQNWLPQANSLYGADESFTSISCATASYCVAVGTDGHVVSTTNGGTTWGSETSGTVSHLTAISCTTTASCVAVGVGGRVLTRTGTTWHVYASGTTHGFSGVSCPTLNTCYAVGAAGTIRVTTNRGATWLAQVSGTTNTLAGIACLAPTYCVADGDFGTVLVTLNGGTWVPKAVPTFNSFRAAAFPDRNHSWLAGYGGTILQNPTLIPSCSSVSLATDVSPQVVGAVVILNATAFGCPDPPDPQFRFYRRSPAGVWTLLRDFNPSSSFSWNTAGYAPGRYTLEAMVKAASSGFAYDAYTVSTFDLQRPACSAINVAQMEASPQPSGTGITFTATSAGCPTPQYEWWINKAGVWSIVPGHDYAHSLDYFDWFTTGLANGTYQLGIWARQKYSTAKYEAYADWTFTLATPAGTTHCQAANIAPASPSPVVKGNTAVFTASAASCDTPQYEWWLRNPAGVWAIVKPYSADSTYTLPTTAAAGTYLVDVWVRQTGSIAKYEAFGYITYAVVNPPVQNCTSVSVAPDIYEPQSPGTTITFTATANGCNSPVYQFYLLPPGGAWTLKQAYGPLNTLTWDTTGLSPGRWQLSVLAKQSGSTATYQSYQWISYQLTFN